MKGGHCVGCDIVVTERERKLVTYTHTCLLSLPLFMEYDSTKERSVSHSVIALYVPTIHHVLTEVIRLCDYNSYSLHCFVVYCAINGRVYYSAVVEVVVLCGSECV